MMERVKVLVGVFVILLGIRIEFGGCQSTISSNSTSVTTEAAYGSGGSGNLSSEGDSEKAAADVSSKESEDLRLSFTGLIRLKDDCNPDATDTAMKFLSISNDDLEKKSEKELADMGVPSDCAFRKTNMEKLRTFLTSKGFLKRPGTLLFLNAQDIRIKMNCKEDGRWKISGAKDDSEWNAKGYSGKRLDTTAPTDALYFRIYTCHSVSAKCSHNFYTITRPQPMIDFPLQFSQGDQIDVTCKMNPCLYTTCKDTKSKPSVPYNFEWTLPNNLFDEKDDKIKRGMPCTNGKDEISKDKGQIYVKFEAGEDGKPVANPMPKKDANVKVELSGKVDVQVDGKNMLVVVQSTVKIEKGDDMHIGEYECIIIDGNGVPSIPSHGSIDDHHIRYTGKGTLHVRNLIWLIIPLILLLIMLIVVLVIHFLSPHKMEHDDGTPYKKDDFVNPEPASSSNPAPEGDVPPMEGEAPPPSAANAPPAPAPK